MSPPNENLQRFNPVRVIKRVDRRPLDPDHIDRILTMAQWAELCGFSLATAQRTIKRGEGPRVVHLSTRRFGVRMSDHIAWCESRAHFRGPEAS